MYFSFVFTLFFFAGQTTDDEILEEKPEHADFMNLVGAKITAKWDLFGAQLNLAPSIMDSLEEDYPRDCYH